MTYNSYMKTVCEKLIIENDETGKCYIRPDWKFVLQSDNLLPESTVKGYNLSIDELFEYMQLEVEKRNLSIDKMSYIANWLFALITETIEPSLTEAENEAAVNIINYMKEKKQLENKEKELAQKEQAVHTKQKVVDFAPGMNFAKRMP